MSEQARVLRLEYIPLAQAVLWDRNPKTHDIGALVESIWRYGFQDPPKFDGALKAIVYGNGRCTAVKMGKDEGRKPPDGIYIIEESGEWALPVVFGVDLESVAEAEAFAIDHNNLTMMGGEFSPSDIARMWDTDKYLEVLKDLAKIDIPPISVDGDDLDALIAARERDVSDDFETFDDNIDVDYRCPKCGYEWSGGIS